MAYRSIVLELTPDNDVRLWTHVEDDWTMAQGFHDAMRSTVEKRNGRVIYASLLNLEGLGDSSGCCGGKGGKVLV